MCSLVCFLEPTTCLLWYNILIQYLNAWCIRKDLKRKLKGVQWLDRKAIGFLKPQTKISVEGLGNRDSV